MVNAELGERVVEARLEPTRVKVGDEDPKEQKEARSQPEALPRRDRQGKVGALGGDEDLGSGDTGGLDALSDLSLVLQGVDSSGSDLSP